MNEKTHSEANLVKFWLAQRDRNVWHRSLTWASRGLICPTTCKRRSRSWAPPRNLHRSSTVESLMREKILGNKEYQIIWHPWGSAKVPDNRLSLLPDCFPWCTEGEIKVCTWLWEIFSCSSLTALPGPAWVLLKYVLQRLFLSSVLRQGVLLALFSMLH